MLHIHTYYSLRYGHNESERTGSTPPGNGWKVLVHADVNNTSASMDMVRLAVKHGLDPVLGTDFRNGAEQQYLLLTATKRGFQQINDHLSEHIHNNTPFEQRAPQMEEVVAIYPFASCDPSMELQDNEYVGVRRRDLSRLQFSNWIKRKDKLIAMQTGTYLDKKGFNAHRLLRAIDNNTLLSKLEKSEEAHPDDLVVGRQALVEDFKDFPFLSNNQTSSYSRSSSIHPS